jgi:hypothetical protein
VIQVTLPKQAIANFNLGHPGNKQAANGRVSDQPPIVALEHFQLSHACAMDRINAPLLASGEQ